VLEPRTSGGYRSSRTTSSWPGRGAASRSAASRPLRRRSGSTYSTVPSGPTSRLSPSRWRHPGTGQGEGGEGGPRRGVQGHPAPDQPHDPLRGIDGGGRKGARVLLHRGQGPTNGTWEKIGKRKIRAPYPEAPARGVGQDGPPARAGLITHPKPHFRKTIEAEIRKMEADGIRLLRDGETISV